jgi:hypothetical protein
MPSANQDSEVGNFASIIELRAFVQAEITRLKTDVDKLFTLTTQQVETNATRDERQRTMYNAVKDARDRVAALSNALDKIKAVDESSVKDIVNREITAAVLKLENQIKLDEANKRLSEMDNPTGPFKRLSDKLDELIASTEEKIDVNKEVHDTALAEIKESAKKASDKASSVESDLKEIKTKVAIYSTIGAVLAVKLLDVVTNALKSLSH